MFSGAYKTSAPLMIYSQLNFHSIFGDTWMIEITLFDRQFLKLKLDDHKCAGAPNL